MLDRKLEKLLKEAQETRQYLIDNKRAGYDKDIFYNLSNFIVKKLNSSFFKNKNAKVIANHFDEILPYIVASNMGIILRNINLLIEQPHFKEKFIDGLKKYPYDIGIEEIFHNFQIGLNGNSSKFDNFVDYDFLKELANMDLNKEFHVTMLNRLNEEKQKNYLNLLVENKCDIPYFAIEYKGNNKEIIYDNLSLFIENSQNLYVLMNFVKDNPKAFSQVKDYIDNNEEKAMDSILREISHYLKLSDSTIKEIIKLMILDVVKNENVKFSDITFVSGGFSIVLLIGSKVIKLGDRASKKIPNNPYIIAPLLRRNFESNGEHCFIEVTERVDTNKRVSREELYQLFKKLRDLKLVWTDVKPINVGRLTKENIIHWRDNINPPEEMLGLDSKRGKTILKEGDLVILDADFIYDENDSNIKHTDSDLLYKEFEEMYQKEKKELQEQKKGQNFNLSDFYETNDYEESEYKGIHR